MAWRDNAPAAFSGKRIIKSSANAPIAQTGRIYSIDNNTEVFSHVKSWSRRRLFFATNMNSQVAGWGAGSP